MLYHVVEIHQEHEVMRMRKANVRHKEIMEVSLPGNPEIDMSDLTNRSSELGLKGKGKGKEKLVQRVPKQDNKEEESVV